MQIRRGWLDRANTVPAFRALDCAGRNIQFDRSDDRQLDVVIYRFVMAQQRKIEIPESVILRYRIAFLRGDEPVMERVVAAARKNAETDDWISYHQAHVLSYRGRLLEARNMARRAVDLAQKSGHAGSVAAHQSGTAVWEGFLGHPDEAHKLAESVSKEPSDPSVEFSAALAFVLAGDAARSEQLTNDLEKRFPEDTAVKFSYLPSLRALILLHRDRAPAAIEALQSAERYEFGVMGDDFVGFSGSLLPIYVRGLAYLQMKKGTEAAAEFEKIVSHRTIVGPGPIAALASLQLGRAYTLAGDSERAKARYEEFLTTWKDADGDLPAIQQAHAEFSLLR